MFSFHKVTIHDREQMQRIFQEDGWFGSEYSFGNNILWGLKYHIEVAYAYDCLIVRYDFRKKSGADESMEDENFLYSYPAGKGDKKAILEELLADCKRKGCRLRLNSVSEKAKEELESWFPDAFLIRENRDYEDYIYDRKKLATLEGRKMHKKRTHVARFKEAGDWSYEALKDDNIEECKKLCKRWVFSREEKWNDDMATELKVLEKGFELRKQLGLTGGVLRQKGVVIAFCMGEAINDQVFDVHFEKALPEYQGAYPLINQQFVLNECGSYSYINREEDTGDPGLRKAKLSYYPEILLKKYDARLSPVIFADFNRHKESIIELWQRVFGDERDFIEDFMTDMLSQGDMLLYMDHGKTVAMAAFLPLTIRQGDEDIPARYVYAVATLPEYRNKGYARAILQEAYEMYQEALILSPAEESLYGYYEGLGFERWVPAGCLEVGLEESGNAGDEDLLVHADPLTAMDYRALRSSCFQGDGLVKWDEEQISYAYKYYLSGQGKALRFQGEDDKEELLMYDIKEDLLLIRECSMPDELLRKKAADLMVATKTKTLKYDHPGLMIRYPENRMKRFDIGEGHFDFSFGD